MNSRNLYPTICILSFVLFCAVASQQTAYAAKPCTGNSVTLTVNADMDFDTIHGLTGRANLASNGAMTYTGSMTGAGLGIGGYVQIDGEKNCNVLISCSATATLSNGSNTATIDNIEVSLQNAVAFGSGTACQGIGNTIITHKIHSLADRNTLFFGGSINGTATIPGSGGLFSTTNTGGNSITLQVIPD